MTYESMKDLARPKQYIAIQNKPDIQTLPSHPGSLKILEEALLETLNNSGIIPPDQVP
jgi:hypothetical protein